ncbi:MAG: TRAP transporter small permease [Desulfarculaceae bacterium]|nr:TRAP transporter small permease [Desulfarculaceae bacterium]MCF8071964.1 TRAP transporter small permease [Desulfarculaceae bacterium]MCF8101481.1 TRAP transporter small permease [Desulfarculaceae bacterium]MCF8115031.1 TRAP transporter small permease [Desulfarculaceae bacterium]
MQKVFSAYHTALDYLEKATYAVVIVLAALLLFNTSLGMFFDTFMGESIPWTEEVNTLLFVWLSLLGAGVIARYGGHIGVDTLTERFPAKVQHGFRVLHTLLALIIVWVMVQYGVQLAEFVGRSQSSIYLDINLFWYYIAVPVSGVILGLASIAYVLPDPRENKPGA